MLIKKLVLILVLFVSANNIYSQVWDVLNPKPTYESLYSVYFANDMTGWAVGLQNEIIKTIDGGMNWSHQIGYVSKNNYTSYNSVKFFDQNSGFVIGNTYDHEFYRSIGIILKTDNGGNVWGNSLILDDLNKNYEVKAISVIDNLNIIVVGRTKIGNDMSDTVNAWNPLLLKSTDGGKNWNDMSASININSFEITDVQFIDKNNLWIIGSLDSNGNSSEDRCMFGKVVFKTTDGGTSWIKLFEKREKSSWSNLIKFSILDIQNVVVIGEKTNNGLSSTLIMRTSDSGNNWIEDTTLYYNISNYQTMNFYDKFNGYISGTKFNNNRINGSRHYILKTTNGGTTWDSVYSINDNMRYLNDSTNYYYEQYYMNGIHFTNQNKGYLVGNQGKIVSTSNGGKDWVMLTKDQFNLDVTGITFVDSLNGWSIGDNSSYKRRSKIFYSSDGGKNWNNQLQDSNYQISNISFYDKNNGIAVGIKHQANNNYFGGVLKTTDGGNNWTPITGPILSRSGTFYTNVFYQDKSNVWITGGYWVGNLPIPIILKSSDAGNNWELDTIGINKKHNYLVGIYFKDKNNGWAYGCFQKVGSKNLLGHFIYKTTDGGSSWKLTYENDNNKNGLINSIAFKDSLNGFAVGLGEKDDALLKSTDAGNTWNKVEIKNNSFQLNLSKITFVSNQIGWINVRSNDFTSSLHTENGGRDWYFTERLQGSSSHCFLNSKTGWSTSSNGTVAKYRNIGIKTLKPINQSYCTGEDIQIPFGFDTKLNHYITFVAQISDSTGSFINSPVIGTSEDYKSGVINAKIPKDLPAGNYKLRVWYSDNDVSITVTKAPSPNITGPEIVCRYSVSTYINKSLPIENIKEWKITGGTIIGDRTTNFVNVKWDELGDTKIEVFEYKGGVSCSGIGELKVKVYDNGVNPNLNIFGKTTICPNESSIQEYTNNDLEVENRWSVVGGKIIGSSIGNKVQVNWISGQKDTIFLEQKIIAGGCINKAFKEIIIDTTAFPKFEITGEEFVCSVQSITYSVPKFTFLKYKWLTNNGSFSGSDTSENVTAKFVNGKAILTLSITNSIGCTKIITKEIVVNLFDLSIIGPLKVCKDSSISRYYAKYKGMTNKWSIPFINRGTIIGKDDQDSVDVIWNHKFNSLLKLNLVQTLKAGCSQSVQISVETQDPSLFTHIPLIKADPREYKDKMFTIPIIMDSTLCNNTLSQSDTLQVKFSINKSFLLPIKSNNLSYVDVGDIRIVDASIPINSNKLNDTLAKIEGWLLLGEKLTSDITIDTISIKNKTLKFINNNGSIELTNISLAGGPRLLTNKSLTLVNLYPIPAQDNLNIEINSQKEQNATILIYNILGEKIFEKIITFKKGTTIENIQFDNNNTNGIYNLIIKSYDCFNEKTFVISEK
ncbi:MAG: YCF48-related protein [Candidatus Kapabacteria bacterium]|nr:YCF48-related protein [Candidatus Kapabacteria bacterium]